MDDSARNLRLRHVVRKSSVRVQRVVEYWMCEVWKVRYCRYHDDIPLDLSIEKSDLHAVK